MNGIEENGENAVVSVTGGIKTGSAVGHDLVSVVGVRALAREKGTGRGMLEMRTLEIPAVEREKGIVWLYREKTAGVGKGVEIERKGAEARIARGKGREAREQREKRWLREMGAWRELSGHWRSMKEKLVRGRRSAGTGNETGTGTADAATGIGIAAGGTGTGIGTTKESATETGVSAKRSTTAPYKTTLLPKMMWATTTREGHRGIWRSTVRMGS